MNSRGEKHYKNTGITERDVVLMREAWALHKHHAKEAKKYRDLHKHHAAEAKNYNVTHLANHFECSLSVTNKIVRNVSWTHLLTQ